MRRHDSTVAIFQLSTALIAGLWGIIVVGTKNADKLGNEPQERWTIGLATLLLVFSSYYHLAYSNQLIRLQLIAERALVLNPSDGAAFPDLLSPMYNSLYSGQIICLTAAAGLIALSIATDLWIFKEKQSIT